MAVAASAAHFIEAQQEMQKPLRPPQGNKFSDGGVKSSEMRRADPSWADAVQLVSSASPLPPIGLVDGSGAGARGKRQQQPGACCRLPERR